MWKRILIAMLLPYFSACLHPGSSEPSDSPSDTSSQVSPGPHGRLPPPPFYLGGIQVNEADPQVWFDGLKAQGMNLVQVTDYARHGDWDSDDLEWDEESPRVLAEIRGAKAAGLNVLLVLRVALAPDHERNAFLWHGMIMPKNDRLLASWFEKYRRFCDRWARIAEREGVDVMMIGSEMNALASTSPVNEVPGLEEYFLNEQKQKDRRRGVLAQKKWIEDKNLSLENSETFDSVEEYLDARIRSEREWAAQLAAGETPSVEGINARRVRLQELWTELIDQVRRTYTGPVGYAANFDQYQDVGFWQHLDFMGINAYFKLRDDPLLNVEEEDLPARLYPLLKNGWSSVLSQIAGFRERRKLEDQPVIFTEMGFTFRRLSTLQPWSDTGFSMVYQPTTRADGSPGEAQEHAVVWRDQPDDYRERALAIRALYEAHSEMPEPFLKGISYWKLSSHGYHKKDESFLIHMDEDGTDPALAELRRFSAGTP